MAAFANGDARVALNTLEMVVLNGDILPDGSTVVPMETLEQCISKKSLLYDKHGEEHYNLISALHKSMRNSDVDAAIYWLARMLEAGEDPLYVARRVVRFASEDVGLANPTAMLQAVAASQALEAVGLPEARLSMAQAIIAICESPKSNSVVMALDQSVADAEKGGFGPVPIHLRDTHYAGHERLGSGAQYQYPHDFPGHWVKQEYMPPEVKGRRYYIPSDQGQELKLRERRKLRGIVDP